VIRGLERMRLAWNVKRISADRQVAKARAMPAARSAAAAGD
jgi:hypothetical protein